MKAIEEKAQAHAEKIFAEMVNKYRNAPWNEFRDALAQIYLTGATEALAGQWRKPEDELPEDGQLVIIREYFRSAKSGRFVVHYKELFYFSEYGFDLETRLNAHLKYRITHWMPIPEPPKTDKK